MLLKLFTLLKILCSVKFILFQIIPNDLITWATRDHQRGHCYYDSRQRVNFEYRWRWSKFMALSISAGFMLHIIGLKFEENHLSCTAVKYSF